MGAREHTAAESPVSSVLSICSLVECKAMISSLLSSQNIAAGEERIISFSNAQCVLLIACDGMNNY